MDQVKQHTENRKTKILNNIIDHYNTMEPFDIDNVSEFWIDVPVVSEEIYNSVIIPNLIRCGAIPKNNLIIGKEYLGHCRNSGKATWDGEKFIYQRYKFGSYFDDDIQHFEDGVNNGYDVFVPLKLNN